MAEGDTNFYNHGLGQALDWVNDNFSVALMDGTYTPDIDADENWDDISANEISATNYTAGGQALSGKAITIDDTNDQAEYDCDNPSWSSLGPATIGYAVIYRDTGTPSTSWLLCYIEIATNSNGGDYTITISGEGVFVNQDGSP